MDIKINRELSGKTVLWVLKCRVRISSKALSSLKAKENGITVNGRHVTVRYILSEGDLLHLGTEDTAQPSEHIIPRCLPLDIIFEDDDIILLNKPSDMPTHPSHGHLDDTLANALAYRAEQAGEAFVFRPTTRLDRDTSGIVLAAKTRLASGKLFSELSAGGFEKTYLCITVGVPEPTVGHIDAPIRRGDTGILMRVVADDGDASVTDYRVLASSRDGSMAFVAVTPRTGRTHQIRVHMKHIGTPLLGDFLYGEESPLLGRHALHAARLAFTHPLSGRRLRISAPLPDDMVRILKEYF